MKKEELHFLECVDRFSKHSPVKVNEHADANSIQNFLQNYILVLGVAFRVHLEQFRC